MPARQHSVPVVPPLPTSVAAPVVVFSVYRLSRIALAARYRVFGVPVKGQATISGKAETGGSDVGQHTCGRHRVKNIRRIHYTHTACRCWGRTPARGY